MRIRRLRLTQFRHLADADVAFGDGLIHISGGNGAGKTTLLNAVLWALYGDAAFVRGAAAAGAATSAELEFQHCDIDCIVTRTATGSEQGPSLQSVLHISNGATGSTSITGNEDVDAHVAALLGAERNEFIRECFIGRRELQQIVRTSRSGQLRLGADVSAVDVGGVTALEQELADTDARMRTLATAPELLAQYTAELERGRTTLAEVEIVALRLHDEWSQKRQEVETKLDGYRRRGEELKLQIAKLTQAGSEGRCPTCEQPLGEGAERVIVRVEDEYYTTTQDMKWLSQRQAQLARKPSDLLEAETRRNSLRALVADRAERAARCEQAMQELWTLATERKRTSERLASLQPASPRPMDEAMLRRLEQSAGEYVARISDWRYTGIAIGPDAHIRLTDEHGTAAMVSGADEDLIAFALRLATQRLRATEQSTPRILFLDEPFGALDAARRGNAVNVLREMLGEWHQIIVASQHVIDGADQVHRVAG